MALAAFALAVVPARAEEEPPATGSDFGGVGLIEMRNARFRPDGTAERTLGVPASQVTKCAFGGPDLTTLFITTAAAGADARDENSSADGRACARTGVGPRPPDRGADGG